METKDKTIMENIDTTGLPESVDSDKEASSVSNGENKSESDPDDIWNRIGGKTLNEGVKSVWSYIKNLKIEQVIGFCIYVVLLGFMIYGFIYLFVLAWDAASNCFAMIAGERFASSYSLIDGDMINSVPICLIVALMVGLLSERCKIFCTILYFLALMFILEVWDYWHIEYTVNGTLGELCFVIMFIIVPVLSIVRFFVSIFTDNEKGNEAKDNNESELL